MRWVDGGAYEALVAPPVIVQFRARTLRTVVASLPQVDGLDSFWEAKRCNGGVLPVAQGEGAHPLEMPRPSALGAWV